MRNRSGAVSIEAEGEPEALERFLEQLVCQPPPLAQVDHVHWERQPARGERGFRIGESQSDAASQIFISPDVATCAGCLAELFDPSDRRFGYPLINCTHCGPRLTIITSAPYDRQRTTMAGFEMCPACRAEYEDPRDRRFHAQPIACPACGPHLELLNAEGKRLDASDLVGALAEQIRDGRIGALKGLGGYHLVCLAGDGTAVAELRRRKARDEKPLAIMVADAEQAAAVGWLGEPECRLLTSPRAPIVLLRRRGASHVAEAVAPNNPWLGVMLPYTPLHHLLMRALDGAPLVMTSGNRSDEPIAYRDSDATERLRGIADFFLTHNRPIRVRCDDSVTRLVGGVESPLRRSRGFAPQPVRPAVQVACPTLAVGGQLKSTFALARGAQTLLSHHLGDLDDLEAYRAFEKDIELYLQLFAIKPQRIAHDLHPDYASTGYAHQRAKRDGAELVAVQHHHAHMASCMAENGLSPTALVLGVTFDGTGYGSDGAVWGGEFLLGDCRGFRRAGHLRYVAMPGGAQAIREPWRMAAAHAIDAGAEVALLKSKVAPVQWRTVQRMLQRRLNSPDTSSMGRLFDAVAALAGVRLRTSYEGQAAIELEWLAAQTPAEGSYPFDVTPPHPSRDAPLVVDPRRLIRAVIDDVCEGVDTGRIARRFHTSIVEMISAVCRRTREVAGGPEAVVLSGGVFCNALLTEEVTERLSADGFQVYRHRQVPPGDGGLSLGQLAVAAAQLRK